VNRSALFLLVPLLAGCNVHSKHSADDDQNVTINADESGHVAFNLPFMQGQVKLPTGMMHNGNFDIDGVKLMPGSSVTGFSLDAHHEGATVNMTFNAPASPDEVRSYFVDQFKQKGVEASLAGDAVTGKSKDGSAFVIQVSPAASGSSGKIQIQSKD
jgi:hypothetical protein